MSRLEKLNKYLQENNETDYYYEARSLVIQRVSEMDNSVPKLLNKAFNHRYTISRIEKAKKKGKKGISRVEPDYHAQLQDQYRQIYMIQKKICKMKMEYEQLKKAMMVIRLLNNYHLEISDLSEQVNEKGLDDDLKEISLKYLFNNEYEQKQIDNYKAGLKKEGLVLWGIKSLDDIETNEMLDLDKSGKKK